MDEEEVATGSAEALARITGGLVSTLPDLDRTDHYGRQNLAAHGKRSELSR